MSTASLRGWYSTDSLCCGVWARMAYINEEMQKTASPLFRISAWTTVFAGKGRLAPRPWLIGEAKVNWYYPELVLLLTGVTRGFCINYGPIPIRYQYPCVSTSTRSPFDAAEGNLTELDTPGQPGSPTFLPGVLPVALFTEKFARSHPCGLDRGELEQL